MLGQTINSYRDPQTGERLSDLLEAVERAMMQSAKGRRMRRRDFRSLWIARINAAARLSGTSYSRLVAGLKKARQALRVARPASGEPQALHGALKVGWDSLAQAHRLLAAIPLDAATEPVMTRQLAVQRYATALLVRLRRLSRNEPVEDDISVLDDEDDLD